MSGSGTLRIAGRAIGDDAPCFVIAEAGVNHDGVVDRAHALVDAAADAGADAVKFQTFSADRLASPAAATASYQRETSGEGSQLDMLRKLELPATAYSELLSHCSDRGITFLSTPFDEGSADLLAELGVEAIKVGSGDLTNRLLLDRLRTIGLPVILSTGMADLDDVEAALGWLDAEHLPVALLHCVSCYPAPVEASNLRAMLSLARFGHPIGWSDHTTGLVTAIAAVALGAAVIEKHVTLDPSAPGPDHAASLDPAGFGELVAGVRDAERALGDGVKRRMPCEEEIAVVARKSLAARRDLSRGQALGRDDVEALRPGSGIAPSELDRIVGRVLVGDVDEGQLLTMEMFEP